MAKKPAIRVALDLETTGLHPEQDAIVEIAAIQFQGSEVIDTFETFVSPGRSIPYRVQRLTGIKPEHLVGAPSFASIAKRLQQFLGDFPIVGHSIPFDVGFLRPRGIARTNPLIDTFELATVLLPSLTSYNLGHVAQSLELRVPQDRHRAMVDTVLAMEVFLALYKKLEIIDLAQLHDLAHLDAPRSWPLLHFFRQELRERQERDGVGRGTALRGSFGDRFAAQLGMDPRVLSFAVAQQSSQTSTLNSQSVIKEQTSVFLPASDSLETDDQPSSLTGSFVRSEVIARTAREAGIKDYQATRSLVYRSLHEHAPLLMDVSIGDGDYIPALLPVFEWLLEASGSQDESSKRLVIACSSQQHARRLIETVLPRLQSLFQSSLPVAYLAERGGYLCTHRWFGAALRRTNGELTAEQARGLAKLGLWAYHTTNGERSEITLLQQELAAWDRISSGVERIPSSTNQKGNSYQQCTYRRKGYCFVSLAEERVKAAQIVITTHTGLFDDLNYSHSLLASIPVRLILDAELLDEENARWGSTELTQNRLLDLLQTLGMDLSDGRYQGLLALAAPTLRENGPGGLSTTPTIAKSDLDNRLQSWFQTLRQARLAVEKVFSSFTALLEEQSQQVTQHKRGETPSRHHSRGNERLDQPLRLNDHIRQLSAWSETEQAWNQLNQRLKAVSDLAQQAEKVILTSQKQRYRVDIGAGEEGSVAAEFVATAHKIIQQQQLLQRALSLNESETVYWLRMPPVQTGNYVSGQRGHDQNDAPTPVLHAQLVQTASLLKNVLLREKTSTIFAGSALTVDNSFSFIRNRFGLDDESCPSHTLTTEHHEQTLLYIPNDVPEPNSPQYQRHLDESLIQLGTSLDGQVVALFTSHASLRSSYATIKPVLEGRGILVLGQGIDGSPRQLWQVFQSQERVVLLGTGSFWDNVEDIQKPPTCLVVTRVPMPVLNDPPIAARAEQYSDQLHQLTVPMAALRVRRALNKLAWNNTNRNAIVFFDRRVISKEYGSIILHSLPRCSQRQGPVSHLTDTLLDWLTGTGSWEDQA